ncbi:MAG: hypothetical protein KKA73_28635 [Chloroflexi bacterium]|nr:hypothetical protein [Chloroflexota bacterium]MBU1751661.1 hypothetical protein [Chloroflexota bacterium]
MESSPQSRAGEIVSHISMILVTVAQLIFFAYFYEYIAWYTIEPDGNITRLSILTDGYFTWLPIPITASILAITAHIIFIIYDNYRFRMIAEIIIYISGIAVTVSLVSIFPFDFSVIPNATAVAVVPIVVTVFFILLAVFYGIVTLVQSIKLIRSYTVNQR